MRHGAAALDNSAPQHPICCSRDIFRPKARFFECGPSMHYTASRNSVPILDEVCQLIFKDEICTIRNDKTVGRDPKRPAVTPLSAALLQEFSHQSQMIWQK